MAAEQLKQLTRKEFLDLGVDAGRKVVALGLMNSVVPIGGLMNATRAIDVAAGPEGNGRSFYIPERSVSDRFSFLKDVDLPHERLLLPRELRGINVNMPDVWDHKDVGEQFLAVAKAQELGATSIRIIIDKRLEKAEGQFNEDVVRKIRKFADIIERLGQGEMKLTVDLFDGHDLFHEMDPNLDWVKLYLATDNADLTKRQQDFFTDESAKSRYKNRLSYLVRELKDIPTIAGWGIGNEMEIPGEDIDGKEKISTLTKWDAEMIQAIRVIDPDRAILLGHRVPWFVDPHYFPDKNKIVSTVHMYPSYEPGVIPSLPFVDESFAKALRGYIRYMAIPLSIQELGIPREREIDDNSTTLTTTRRVPVPDDSYLVEFMEQALKGCIDEPQGASILDILRGRKMLYVLNLGLWKLDSNDNSIDVSPETHPMVSEATNFIGPILRDRNSL